MSRSVLVIGAGAREHALAWKLAQSSRVSRVIVAPGNDGFSSSWERWQVSLSQKTPEFESLAQRALEARVDLAVIGPDNALADGIVDVFERLGIRTFGPSSGAARIESSKAFAKEIMSAARIPTARYEIVSSFEEAEKFLNSAPWPPYSGSGWVVKADGLALGKGVQVCKRLEDALGAARSLISLSGQLVIEECLSGEEISWMAFCEGERCALLDPARDYKRVLEGDLGPNTGGMGAFSPVPGITQALEDRIRAEVFLPALRELKQRGFPFRGVLYAGLMVDFKRDRYWVLEFNARFGDPETQVLLPRMADDLYLWCDAVARGDLSGFPGRVPFSKEHAVYVVGAAGGYPEHPEKGQKITGPLLSQKNDKKPSYFSAGVLRTPEGLVTSGGRVFGALGLGPDFEIARLQAYENLSQVKFPGIQFRSDIAKGLDQR